MADEGKPAARRNTWIIVGLLGGGVVVLAVALASVGTQLDKARIDRDSLDDEVTSLEEQVDSLTSERDTLKTKTDEHLKAIEQLKTDLEHVRSQQAQQPPAASPPAPQSSAPATQ